MKIISLTLFLFPQILLAQEIISNFSRTDSICLDEKIELINTSQNSNSYVWDFCFDALSNDYSTRDVIDISEASSPEGIEIVYDAGKWFGFAASRGNNKIFRLDFGTSLENTPAIIDLGNISGLVTGPKEIRFVKESNDWFGLLTNYGSSNIVRLSFGNSLSNTPIGTNLGNLSNWNTLRGSDLVQTKDSLLLIVSSSNNNKLTLVNFGNSITNNPSAQDILDIGIGNSLINRPMGVSLKTDGDNWYGLVCSYSANKVVMMDFGSSLFGEPSFSDAGALDLPTDCSLEQDGNDFYGIIQSRNNGLYRLDFGISLSSIPSLEYMPNATGLSNVFNICLVRNSPTWSLFTIGVSDKMIKKIEFQDICDEISQNSSIDFEPPNISFSMPGNFAIELTAFDQYGNFDKHLDTVIVRDISSPTTSFISSNTCISNQNTFSASSSDDPSITSWNWDFGDGVGSSSIQNPSYQYLNPGSYDVSLAIEAVNGCTNSVNKTIHIYDPPSANFTYPLTTICSNNEILFTNQTNFSGPDSIITYQWNMNDESLPIEIDPSYTFSSGGDKDITLTASIPGCSSELTKTINITPGPSTSFSFKGICEYDEFSFTNNTTGDSITGYQWDFGDGYFSENNSPVHSYEAGGNYVVSLTASNSSGCNSRLQQVVPVRFLAELNFTNDLACSNNSVTLFDQSTVQEANILERYWELENTTLGYQKTGTGPSPTFLLEDAGNYTATLVSETNFGCLDTLVRIVDVKKSPIADFIIDNTCFGDSTSFAPNVELEEGANLISADWLIDDNFYSQEEVKFKFLQPGAYQTELYVRASNFCPDNITKSITIDPLPEISINFSSECEDQLIDISALIHSPSDPVVSYNWLIDDNPVSLQEQFQYKFKKDDDYSVILNALTANECFISKNTTLTINPSPTSKFDVFPSMGASPLNAQFSDRSQGAQKVSYQFSHYTDEESSEENPTYTYYEIGEDFATQIVENEYGCKDSSTQLIEVLIPIYDISINDVRLNETSDELTFTVELQNNGTILINNPTIRIEVADKLLLNHKLETTLKPGEVNEYLIDFNIIKNPNEPLSFICFSIDEALGNYTDENPYDNRQCINVDDTFTVLEPYPNPSKTFVEIPIILPEGGSCNLKMIGESGNIVYSKNFKGFNSGINFIKMDLTPYRRGYYLLKIEHRDFNTTKKIVVQ